VKRANYTKPTPVQKHSIPIVLAGHDLMSCAQTGTPCIWVSLVQSYLTFGPRFWQDCGFPCAAAERHAA
jgi:ATP-dependent RNA helicase DDX3X